MDDFDGGNAAIGKVEFDVVDSLLDEVGRLVGLVVETHHCTDLQFFEDGDVVVGSKGAVLRGVGGTLYLSTGLSEGELKATNLLGMIQLRSPFSIFS